MIRRCGLWCNDLHARVTNGKAVEYLTPVSNHHQSILKVGSGTFSEVRRSVHNTLRTQPNRRSSSHDTKGTLP